MSELKMYMIFCAGGKGVVIGYVRGEPEQGKPCFVENGRMVLRWEGTRGIFAVPTEGFEPGSRVTKRVPYGCTSPVTEWFRIEPEAEKKINDWPEC